MNHTEKAMCNCIDKLEMSTRAKYEDQIGPVDDMQVNFDQKAIVIGTGEFRMNGVCTVSFCKDGKGQKLKRYFLFTYCPFCGEKYQD